MKKRFNEGNQIHRYVLCLKELLSFSFISDQDPNPDQQKAKSSSPDPEDWQKSNLAVDLKVEVYPD
jgi:hypothetical protein